MKPPTGEAAQDRADRELAPFLLGMEEAGLDRTTPPPPGEDGWIEMYQAGREVALALT